MKKVDLDKEKEMLNKMGPEFFTDKAMSIDKKQILMMVKRGIPYCKGPKVLEMSYNDRGWTDALFEKGFDLTVIEGSKFNVEYAKKKFGDKIKIIHTLFEEFEPTEKYNSIIMSCILEHVVDAVDVMRKAATWLEDDGVIVAVVPNAISLHRRIGYHAGMIKVMDELSPVDISVGHRRLYTIESFEKEIKEAGLYSSPMQGIFLKPLSSDRMMDWSDELLNAFDQMGNELVPYAGYLFTVCSKNPEVVKNLTATQNQYAKKGEFHFPGEGSNK